jgi:hypothetical protein
MVDVCCYFGRPWLRRAAIVILSFVLPGCSYQGFGGVDQHFAEYRARPPRNNTVTVCSAYGCRSQTNFRFTAVDIKTIQRLMNGAGKASTPDQEREATARAMAWMEKRVGGRYIGGSAGTMSQAWAILPRWTAPTWRPT